jgi:GT2 family glycosyltransferase
MRSPIESAQVVRISLDEPLQPVRVESDRRHALLVVSRNGDIVGEVLVAAAGTLPVDFLRAEIGRVLRSRLIRHELAAAFLRAVRPGTGTDGQVPPPSVSVVICTHDQPRELPACLESLRDLNTPPDEVLVVDSCPRDDEVQRVCAGHPVRYLVERHPGLSRARNRGVSEARGELIAFTDDDCVVDPRWLDGLREAFEDALTMAVVGYVGPLELDTRSQCLAHLRNDPPHHVEREVIDGASETTHVDADDRNVVFRRRGLAKMGPFAEALGPGTPTRSGQATDIFHRILARGYRIAFDPGRVVWHRHPRRYQRLRSQRFGRGAGVTANATLWFFHRWELAGVGLTARFWRRLLSQLSAGLRRDDPRIPLGLTLAEAAGSLAGPWLLLRSARRARWDPELHGLRGGVPRERAATRVRASDQPSLTVAIASYNRRDQLEGLLRALADQTYPANRFEVVLVIDGSTDGSVELARSLEMPYSLRVREQENRGLGPSRNRGVREAMMPIIVFLDDDMLPETSYLAEHARAHAEALDNHVALSYCPPAIEGTDLLSLNVRAWWEDLFRRKGEPDHQWTFVDFSDGTASLPRSLFLASSGFDESFRERRQDWELGLRLLQQGVRFAYYPAARALHHIDPSRTKELLYARQEGRSDVQLGMKHPRLGATLPVARFAAAVCEANSSDGTKASARAALFRSAYQRPRTTALSMQSVIPMLDVLERAGLRHSWKRLWGALRAHAEIQGIRDALPSLEAYREFVGRVFGEESTETLTVWFDEPDGLRVPPDAGAVELLVGYRGGPTARVDLLKAGDQWDWQAVTDLVVEQAARSLAEHGDEALPGALGPGHVTGMPGG